MYLGRWRVKYMGSKRWMLQNGLAELIHSRVSQYERFVDLFCGSSAVSWHVASNHAVPVLASDLQEFCRVLAAAVVCRTGALGHYWIDSWIDRATASVPDHPLFEAAIDVEHCGEKIGIVEYTTAARELCSKASTPVTAAYGGHYFSPLQAIYFDSLRSAAPRRRPHRMAALAALVQTASVCAASPGHTAQPFGPTTSAEPYLRHAWSKDVVERVRHYGERLSAIGPKKQGVALSCDANTIAGGLSDGDLVFVDPPYSSVHYSRFYHVLEAIAAGTCVQVSGVGRYPPRELRPRSRYSLPSEAGFALQQLLEKIGECRSGVIVTFPAGMASNGLSGQRVIDIARNWFAVDYIKVKSRFSTLGGNTRNRSARVRTEELLLSLEPK